MLAGWAVALLLSGCATSAVTGAERNPQDPYEALNRKTFALNDRLDRRVVKPVALAYEKTLPSVVREAVTNFFGNIGDAWSAVNWLLQGEVQRGIEQGARVAWNSTLGLAGLIDVGTPMGLDKRSQDLGQTLGAWGVGPGAYLVLPAFGPSSVRDAAALPIDRWATGAALTSDMGVRNTLFVTELVSVRAGLLGPEKLLNDIALDRYTFIRDAYLQRRAAKPRKAEDDEGFEIVTPPAPPASASR